MAIMVNSGDSTTNTSDSGPGAARTAPDLAIPDPSGDDMTNVNPGASPTLEAIAVDPLLDDSQRDLLTRLYPACVHVSALDAEGRGR
jgi:hypothetical protein